MKGGSGITAGLPLPLFWGLPTHTCVSASQKRENKIRISNISINQTRSVDSTKLMTQLRKRLHYKQEDLSLITNTQVKSTECWCIFPVSMSVRAHTGGSFVLAGKPAQLQVSVRLFLKQTRLSLRMDTLAPRVVHRCKYTQGSSMLLWIRICEMKSNPQYNTLYLEWGIWELIWP